MKKSNISLYQRLKVIKKNALPTDAPLIPEGNEIAQLDARISSVLDLFKKYQKKKSTEMLCFIMYDITDNKVRKEIAKFLIEKGMIRVQKSVFLGSLKAKLYQQIAQDLKEVQSLYENNDSIMIIPVSESEVNRMKLIGQQVDFDMAIKTKGSIII
ncbi:CRISPR-associated endonuclease Cas2 [Persicobacter psychrovividus]|uniref:CRISPR-associated endoribonuclease Cas2 n=1 Tax=Persicobacter psychrovividus TaxID=387638 RepID=A0ABN6LFW9_9BACT|nr:hypothetical protein PEPS_43460 [Persicobacter psychrovividus]